MATVVDEIVVRFIGETGNLDKSISHVNRGLASVGRTSVIAGAATSAVFGGVAGAALMAAANLEQTSIAFRTLTGDMEVANQLMRDMEQFSAKTPFQLSEVEAAGKRLLAMGFNAKEILPTLHDVGNVTAGIGIEGGRFDRIIHNLAQVKTQGHLTSREFRDFAVNGVPLMEALVQTMKGLPENANAAAQAIDEMIQRGQISANDVRRAFRFMATEGRFANLMFEQSKTFLGVVSNIKDKVIIVLRGIGKAFVEPLKAMLRPVVKFLDMIALASDETKKMIGYLLLFGTLAGFALTAFGGILTILTGIGLLIAGLSFIGGMIAPFLPAIIAIGSALAVVSGLAIQAGLALKGYEASFAGAKQAVMDMIPVIADLTKKTVGFFLNLRHNLGVLFQWVKDNLFNFMVLPQKMLIDAMAISFEFIVKNFAHTVNTMFKLVGFFTQSAKNLIVYTFRWVFQGGMIASLKEGLSKAYNIIVDFFSRITKGIMTGKFDLFGSFLAGQELTNEEGFLKGLNDIRKEFFAGLEGAESNFDYFNNEALEKLKTAFEDSAKSAGEWGMVFDNIMDEAADSTQQVTAELQALRNMFANRDDFHITQEGLVFGVFEEAKKVAEAEADRYAMAGPVKPMTGFGKGHLARSQAAQADSVGFIDSINYMNNIEGRNIGMPGQGPLLDSPTPIPVAFPSNEMLETNSPQLNTKIDLLLNLMESNSHSTQLRTLGEGGEDFPL